MQQFGGPILEGPIADAEGQLPPSTPLKGHPPLPVGTLSDLCWWTDKTWDSDFGHDACHLIHVFLEVSQDVAHEEGSQHSNLVSIKQLKGAVLLREVHQPASGGTNSHGPRCHEQTAPKSNIRVVRRDHKREFFILRYTSGDPRNRRKGKSQVQKVKRARSFNAVRIVACKDGRDLSYLYTVEGKRSASDLNPAVP
ncbi:MAG: hypothetical protein FRX49_00353 [Trebouxia sp. A1-2]|nr:MAG: hypothetical protein FRX49_00353 [Trebouxia sp. A1-2]